MNILNYEDALTLVDQTVTLAGEETELKVKVVGVETSLLHGDEWSAYTIVFQSDDGEIDGGQGTFELSHPEFESQMIFVSSNSQTEIEAVISSKK